MSNLFIYVPFIRDVQNSDLRGNANDLVKDTKVPCTVNSIEIKKVTSIFAGEEQPNTIQSCDIFIVHAHGGQNDSDMSDNLGNNVTMQTVIGKLILMGAPNASQAFFCVCYSAALNHIAKAWKNAHNYMQVRGAAGIVQGAIAQITRQGTIRNAMFFNNDQRMQTM